MREKTVGKTIFTQHSFSEYVEFSLNNRDADAASSKKGNKEFYGDAKSFEQMYERCYDGYNAKRIGDARASIGAMVTQDKPYVELRVIGDELDVPTFLSGDMKCFWADSDIPTPPKVHIVYQSVASASVDANNFINHGAAVAVICDVLNELGDTRISSLFMGKGSVEPNMNLIQVIDVKDYTETLDVPRIGAITHPSFLRRITFGHIEHHGAVSGYGRPITLKEKGEVVDEADLLDWLRIDADEFVLEIKSPSDSLFKEEESTMAYVKSICQAVEQAISNGEKHLKEQ